MNIKRQGKRNKKKNNGFQREQGYISGLGRTADIILSVVLILISLLALLPVILVIIISFSSEEAIIESGYSFFPEELSLDAYRYLLGHLGKILQSLGPFFRFFSSAPWPMLSAGRIFFSGSFIPQ